MAEKADLQGRLLRLLVLILAFVAVASAVVHFSIQSRLDAVPASEAPSMYALLSVQTWLQAALIGGLLVLIGYFVILPVARRVERSQAELAEKEAALAHARSHDKLTGFLDRENFEMLLEHSCAVGDRHDRALGLLRIGLSGVPGDGGRVDYAVTDTLMAATAKSIERTIRAADRPARLGEAEFAVLVSEVRTVEGLGRLAERLLEEIKTGRHSAGLPAEVTCAIGVAASWPHEENFAETLMRRSQAALVEAAAAGGDAWRYDPATLRSVQERMSAAS